MTVRSLRWLPNALSASRGVLSIPVFVAGANGEWVLGFWLILAALITDFLDGLAAKKLRAESVIGGHIDRVSDFLLAAMGTLGLIAGANIVSWWWVVPAFAVSGFVGYVKFFLPEDHKVRRITNIFSVTILFGTWIFIVWGYGWQAFGWSWWYAPITLALLVSAARLKLHRLRYWFGWLFSKPSARPARSASGRRR
jgi:phosphatidylglycerophosphate synthase